MFRQIPVVGVGPEGGEFRRAKAGLDADASIVLGNGVASEEGEETGSEGTRPRAAGFGRDENGGKAGDFHEQRVERGIGKVMKKKIGEDEFGGWGGVGPIGHVGGNDRGKPVLSAEMLERGVGNAGLAIDKKKAGAVSALGEGSWQDPAEKMTIP